MTTMNDFGYDVWRVARINERAEAYRKDAELAEKRVAVYQEFMRRIILTNGKFEWDEEYLQHRFADAINDCHEALQDIDAGEEEAGADDDGD